MKLTLTITKGEEFYIGSIKEIPEVLTQGKTEEEAKMNLLDALAEYQEDVAFAKLLRKADNSGNGSLAKVKAHLKSLHQ